MAAVLRPLVIGLVLVAVLFGTVGNAAASTGGPSPISGFKTANAFVIVSAQGLLSVNPVNPGDQVFGDTIWLQVINLAGARTVTLTTTQTGGGGPPLYGNITFPLGAFNVTTLPYGLPSTVQLRATHLCIDGGCMDFAHVSPVTIIPAGVLNLGGLDLVILSTVIECALFTIPALLAARSFGRRALWAPKWKAFLWAPHIFSLFFFVTVLDYRAFDALLGGVTFLLYAPIWGAVVFMWSLHLFNVAAIVEVTKLNPQGGHHLTEWRSKIAIGDMPDGSKIFIGTGWTDWIARLRGHYSYAWRPSPDSRAPTEIPVSKFQVPQHNDSPLDDFAILGSPDLPAHLALKERDPPTRHYYVDTDTPFDPKLPRLSLHRTETVPASMKDGVTVAEHPRRRWSLPHFEVPGESGARLADLHYKDVAVASVMVWEAERAYKRLELANTRITALKAQVRVKADELAEIRSNEKWAFLDADMSPLSDEQAREQSRPRGPGAPPGEPPRPAVSLVVPNVPDPAAAKDGPKGRRP